MNKPDFSVKPTLTPAQAIGVLTALEKFRFEYVNSARWNSRLDGAHRQVRAALIDAGWEPDADGKGWHRNG